MQRRLTLAMLAITSLAIVLVGAGVLLLTQIGARQTARGQVTEQLEALDGIVSSGESIERVGATLRRLGQAFDADDLQVVRVSSNGSVEVLGQQGPSQSNVTLSEDQRASLATGDIVLLDSGRSVVGLRATTFAPPRRPGGSRADADGSTAVLVRQRVATVARDAQTWFLVSAAAVLVTSALVANWLAARFIRPIRQIEKTTVRIAEGDLQARVDVHGKDELAQLGTAVNTMSMQLDRSRSAEQEFLMSVSHDLRTPLTSISGYAEALVDGATDEPAQAGAVIAANAGRLNRLVDDLLDLARLNANRFRFELAPTNCAHVVQDTVASQQPRADEYGLVVRSTIGQGDVPMVVLDGQRLAQAIGNLIDNAVKYAESEVAVAVEEVGQEVLITVSDDGPGIPEVDLPHVFERLYVTKLQPRRAENSSGLGLAIVAELVAGMGGRIEARRGQSGGTAMTMRFPVEAGTARPSIRTAG